MRFIIIACALMSTMACAAEEPESLNWERIYATKTLNVEERAQQKVWLERAFVPSLNTSVGRIVNKFAEDFGCQTMSVDKQKDNKVVMTKHFMAPGGSTSLMETVGDKDLEMYFDCIELRPMDDFIQNQYIEEGKSKRLRM